MSTAELVELVRARHPEAVAVVDGADMVTYGQLCRAASALRERLAEAGVRSGDLVGIALPRGWRVVATILAIWSHGCGYVPLDPDYPAERLELVVADTGLLAVVAETDGHRLPAGMTLVAPPVSDPLSSSPRSVAVTPSGTPAYVIHTSGSTGAPKGVEVPGSAVRALCRSVAEVFDFTAEDVWTWCHSHSFDFSVWEIWGPLSTGGRIVVVSAATTRRPDLLLKLLASERVTVMSQVPSSFKYLVKAYERTPVDLALRYVVFGGEALDRPSVRRWMALRPDSEALVDMYGITETTVHVTHRRLTPQDVAADTGGTRIGVPLPHLAMVLLDASGAVVPEGQAGEIHVRGESLALGYRGMPGATARAFPVLAVGGTRHRWYRTGDMARQLADGSFEYLGRNDRQIALRGYRIEPGEVETVLRRVPTVLDAIVDIEPAGGGESVLVAYVVASRELDIAALRETCRAGLPTHLVPGRVVVVAEIPLTPSGKLDRAALTANRRSPAP